MQKTTELRSIIHNMFTPADPAAAVEKHPLMEAISGNRLSLIQVRETALQIYHVVLHFPRFLAAILTNIPNHHMRMPLVDNLYEEHGRMNEAYVHSNTYRQFLFGIGLSEEEITESKPITGVTAYNRAIIDLCLHHHYTEGLAALGVIEEIVARVSPVIATFAKQAFSTQQKELFHFSSHETLDISHANEIYELVEMSDDPGNRQRIIQGFELGMYYHRRMYSDVLEWVQQKC